MATALPGTAFHSSSFIRLLADLADARPAPAAPGPAPGLADTLDGWLNWTDAIALSSALNGPAPALAAPTGADAPAGEAHQALRQAVDRVRAALAQAIRSDPLLGAAAPARRAPERGQPAADPVEDASTRLQRCHTKHQRAMDAQLGPLRASVRAALASRSPDLARLAALDAVMDQALAVRERHLLGQVPGLVARPLQRPPPAPAPAPADTAPAPEPEPDHLARLQARWQALLLAELDHRMQAIDGLLDALHSAKPAVPAQP